MKIHFRMLLLAALAGLAPVSGAEEPKAEPAITVASYYFGNYHPGDARNAKTKGPEWSEWELVKAAKPRFPGHQQPRVPLWGYGDESDPAVMAQKIDAAGDHGVNAFIFDWYYYNDGPFLERPIDNGFQLEIEKGITAAIGRDGTKLLDSIIPLGRHAKAEEIARMVLFHASALGSFTTGSVLMADGGMHI